MSATEHQMQSRYETAADTPAGRLEEKPGDDLLQFVICLIGSEEFAVDVLSVQEINRIVEVTRVPKTPPYVEGVINLRGRIIPVLDLRKLFGLSGAQQTTHTRICLLYTSDAADERSSVDIGGRRILKKKKKTNKDETRRW